MATKRSGGKIDAPAKIAPRQTASKKAAAHESPGQKSARLELATLLDELDDVGIDFLLEQARVHRYNMEVEKLNAAAAKAAAGKGPRVPDTPSGLPLRIERSKDGSSYHIVAGGTWKMFTAEEMASMLRIARGGESPEDVGRRLRAWFGRERKDVLIDLGLDGPSIGMARDLGELILRTFAPR